MEPMDYIGLDVPKCKISYCVKDSGGKLYSEGSMPATRFDLNRWVKRFLSARHQKEFAIHLHTMLLHYRPEHVTGERSFRGL